MATYVALLSCCLVYFLGSVDGLTPSCTSVRTKYLAKGLLQSDVPTQAVSGESRASSCWGCFVQKLRDFSLSISSNEITDLEINVVSLKSL
jgi:hypothetical protein